mmetsp:Transcript_72476/g.172778  ORF Transcript_72476/g.172778 Transcript_72476/m.172778 type:complete len:756 (+) Transcript_72476:37-2304(+)
MAAVPSKGRDVYDDDGAELDEAVVEEGVDEVLRTGQAPSDRLQARKWQPETQEEEKLEKQWKQLTKQMTKALEDEAAASGARIITDGQRKSRSNSSATVPLRQNSVPALKAKALDSQPTSSSLASGANYPGQEVDEGPSHIKPKLQRSRNFAVEQSSSHSQDFESSVSDPTPGCTQGNWRYACVQKSGINVLEGPSTLRGSTGSSVSFGSVVKVCERGCIGHGDEEDIMWLRLTDGSGWLPDRDHQGYIMRKLGEPEDSKVDKCCLLSPELYRYIPLYQELGVVNMNIWSVDQSKPLIEPGGPLVVKDHVTMTCLIPQGNKRPPVEESLTFAYVENLDPDGVQEGWILDQVEVSKKQSVLVDVESLEPESGCQALILRQCQTTFSPGRGPDKPGRKFAAKTLKPGEMYSVQEQLTTSDAAGVSRKWFRLTGLGWVGVDVGKGDIALDILTPEPVCEVWICKDRNGAPLYTAPAFENSLKKKVKMKTRQRIVVKEKAVTSKGNLWLHTKVGWIPECDPKGNRRMELHPDSKKKGQSQPGTSGCPKATMPMPPPSGCGYPPPPSAGQWSSGPQWGAGPPPPGPPASWSRASPPGGPMRSEVVAGSQQSGGWGPPPAASGGWGPPPPSGGGWGGPPPPPPSSSWGSQPPPQSCSGGWGAPAGPPGPPRTGPPMSSGYPGGGQGWGAGQMSVDIHVSGPQTSWSQQCQGCPPQSRMPPPPPPSNGWNQYPGGGGGWGGAAGTPAWSQPCHSGPCGTPAW